MKEPTAFLMYIDQLDTALPMLSMEQRGELLTALFEHARRGEYEVKDNMVRMAFGLMSKTMDANFEKYKDICERRTEYGRKGGLASGKARREQAEANEANEAKASKSKQNEHNTNTKTKTNTNTKQNQEKDYAASLPDLSPEEEEDIRFEFGSRADGLLDDVQMYYEQNPDRRFPGWSAAVAQFDRNQQRWGRGSGSADQTIADMVASAFGGKGGTK